MKIIRILAIVALTLAAVWAYNVDWKDREINVLKLQNERLRQAITRLTHEDDIGYAEVVRQETVNGALHTTYRFVETRRGDSQEKLSEKLFMVKGDIVHFDCLIVTFDEKMVMDGKKRSMYLWRRTYGEDTAPEEGPLLQDMGQEPLRYENFFGKLAPGDVTYSRNDPRPQFWQTLWDLSNNPEARDRFGIKSIYGNVNYLQLKPGMKYLFKINNNGKISPKAIDTKTLN